MMKLGHLTTVVKLLSLSHCIEHAFRLICICSLVTRIALGLTRSATNAGSADGVHGVVPNVAVKLIASNK